MTGHPGPQARPLTNLIFNLCRSLGDPGGRGNSPWLIFLSREEHQLPRAVLVTSVHDRGPADAVGDLDRFRRVFYDCLTARADALFDLTDAVLCADGPVRSLVELSLVGEHRRGHGALYGRLVPDGSRHGGRRPALPVQPFLRCAGDVAARIGDLDLQAVQVLLPVQALDVPSRRAGVPSLPTARWFGDGDRHSRTPVQVTLDSGQTPSLSAAATHLREEVSRLDQRVFACESHSDTDHDPKALRPPFDSGFWNGPLRHRVTFSGTLAEWSLDALGGLGGFLADLSAQHGITTSVLLTVTRS